jgi:spermidine/putrescine transport system ATP-binding protein
MDSAAVELRDVSKEFQEARGRQSVKAMDSVSLSIPEGEFFALLGPSGCGKTTTLRAIAGFEQPDSGEILIRGQPVQGIPAFHRPVNTVFQDYALFPHMTVLQNVQFGLKMSRVPAREARERALEALELVQLPHTAPRKPRQLSGGQRQRIALARALVNRPAVLLLDEPLGALDLKLRKAMQFELKKMQQQIGITFVFVTHDQEEAMTMADRIAVMNGGRVLQVGTPHEIYEQPGNRFVADFIGETNFIAGVFSGGQGEQGVVTLSDGRSIKAPLGGSAPAPGSPVTVAIRPERIRLAQSAATAGSSLTGTVSEVHYLGTDTRYHVDTGAGITLVVRRQNLGHGDAEPWQVGQQVTASWSQGSATILS